MDKNILVAIFVKLFLDITNITLFFKNFSNSKVDFRVSSKARILTS